MAKYMMALDAGTYNKRVIGGSYYEKIHYGTGRRDNK